MVTKVLIVADFNRRRGWSASNRSAQTNVDAEDFSEFFSSIFGANGEFEQSRGGAQRGGKGKDIEVEMPIFLEDTLTEESKNIEYQIPSYHGAHLIYVKKSLKVKIPLGALDGERIRLKEQGVPSLSGDESGDLYLHIFIKELCHHENIEQDTLVTVVEYVIAKPVEESDVSEWVFDARSIYWIKKALGLHRDLELEWVAVSMVLDLLQQKKEWQREKLQLQRQFARFVSNGNHGC
jgi:DnaJ-class molecular chaperone